ncbi:16S rRNA (uracil(1498)-N(3))-methyltransferase [Motiliproteus sediminis]|uniref:16S rRNA (uracil(1498)-N(3))-methyltransferase n=1 Tax=Motiliproteus sediminis TaxID=1468178 RepID=UPI001AEFF20C|nr:16S rRNA (uracil(1498)-N(3))-methyltransferase [Motiliproteus sediminis]
MRIPRVYEPQPLASGELVQLSDFAAQHLGRALRMQCGDAVKLFNGDGQEFDATLDEVGRKRVTARIGSPRQRAVESPLRIELGQGLSRGERMDYAVQKATELGVSAITPIQTERCEVRLKGDREQKRTQHWQSVAVSAAEQSGRLRVPEVRAPQTLADWLATADADLKLVLHPEAPASLLDLPAPQSVALLIGPEGGLSDDEVVAAQAAGFKALSLGPRVLRTETAPVAALTLLQYLWGDLR